MSLRARAAAARCEGVTQPSLVGAEDILSTAPTRKNAQKQF